MYIFAGPHKLISGHHCPKNLLFNNRQIHFWTRQIIVMDVSKHIIHSQEKHFGIIIRFN